MNDHTQQDVCCLMGDPIAGNPTHYMLEQAFGVANLDWRFLSFQVSALQLEAALRGARVFGFRGIMLAPPHRGRVQPYLEQVGNVVRLSGQANCIVRSGDALVGRNTEGRGLRRLIEQATSLAGRRTTILGDRRMVRSIAAELALAGVEEIAFFCESIGAFEPLAETLRSETSLSSCTVNRLTPDFDKYDGCDLLIDARTSPFADHYEVYPLDVGSLPSDVVVADLAFNPPSTTLVRDAEARGLVVVDGLRLLVEQAALAFEEWTGHEADRESMREAVEEFLVL